LKIKLYIYIDMKIVKKGYNRPTHECCVCKIQSLEMTLAFISLAPFLCLYPQGPWFTYVGPFCSYNILLDYLLSCVLIFANICSILEGYGILFSNLVDFALPCMWHVASWGAWTLTNLLCSFNVNKRSEIIIHQRC